LFTARIFSLFMSKLFMAYLLCGRKFFALTFRSFQLDPSPPLIDEFQYHNEPSKEHEIKLSHENGWKQTSSTGSECVWHIINGFFWLLTSYKHINPLVLPHAIKWCWFGWLAKHNMGEQALSSIKVIDAFLLSLLRVSHSFMRPNESATAISNCFKYKTLFKLHNWL